MRLGFCRARIIPLSKKQAFLKRYYNTKEQRNDRTIMTEYKYIKINPYTLLANIGLEKESLRVTSDGRLAQTPHPFPDDVHLDVDFSENQMELITGIHDSPNKVYDELVRLHHQALRTLSERQSGPEFLWPFSNPPHVESPDENLPMQFRGENRWKTEYRIHLQERYGTELMLYSGIHFNFSFKDEFFEELERQGISKEAAYLNLAAWTTRYAWLIVYLLAASPVSDSSFAKARNLSADTMKQYASPRCSEIGYWNTFDPILDYSNLERYIQSIRRYVDDGTLMYPAELYYPVRLKPAGRYSMETLESDGISHIEIRIIDENPYSSVGIFPEDIQFLHLLMVYLMHQPVKVFLPEEQVQALRDMKAAARFDDQFPLSSGRALRDVAKDALHRMEGFFRKGAFSHIEREYIRETMDYQWKKFAPGFRTAERVRADFEGDYMTKGLNLAKKYSAELLRSEGINPKQ